MGDRGKEQSNMSACSRAKRKKNVTNCHRTFRSPLNTLYTWDISHTLTTLYHPYAHKLSALTEYLKQKLHQQHAKHLSHSHPIQVGQNVQLQHNSPGVFVNALIDTPAGHEFFNFVSISFENLRFSSYQFIQ